MSDERVIKAPLAVLVGHLLLKGKLTLATAESCTGGLIGHRLTEVPGSSEYFLGGIIAYSNVIKERLLGVKPETLERHGAVSAETAGEMARGARRVLGADVAVSVTGIAGPGGGTIDKPNGLTYIALATATYERVECFVWDKDRTGNKWASSQAALQMLHDYLAARITP
jgi:PncC family amidohydrolase